MSDDLFTEFKKTFPAVKDVFSLTDSEGQSYFRIVLIDGSDYIESDGITRYIDEANGYFAPSDFVKKLRDMEEQMIPRIAPTGFSTIEESLTGFREWVSHLDNYVQGCQAQKDDISFWLPLFVAEFRKHGVTLPTI